MRERLSPDARRRLLEQLHDYRRQAWEDGRKAGYEAGETNARAELEPRLRRLEKDVQRALAQRMPPAEMDALADRIEHEVAGVLEHET
jgi:uncharacterized protein (DUF2267 family)